MDRRPDQARSTIRRQLRAAAALLVIVAGVAVAGLGVFWLAGGRPLLAGNRDHDFGTVGLADGPVTLEHTFVLSNRTRQPVEIGEIRTTCGCAVASPSSQAVDPGEQVEIDATLALSKEGRKSARIFLRYRNGEVDVLRLEAAARMRQRLIAAAPTAKLARGRPVERMIFFLDYDGNDEPPPPRITAPAGIEAAFGEWRLVKRRRRSEGLPARWRGRLRVGQTADALPEDAALVIQVGADQQLVLPLRPGSPRGSRPDDR